MYEFETLVDVDYSSPKTDSENNISLVSKKVKIKWRLELEMRDWGIKCFLTMVDDQKITLDFEQDIYDHNDVWIDTKYFSREITISDAEVVYSVPEYEENMFSQLAPNELIIEENKTTVRF